MNNILHQFKICVELRSAENHPGSRPPGTPSLLENVGSLVETMNILTNTTLCEYGLLP